MYRILLSLVFTCAYASACAQVNYVKNPSFERYDTCPYSVGQVYFSTNWQNAVLFNFFKGVEYFNKCAAGDFLITCPNNAAFYQMPRSGDGMMGVQTYYDKTLPRPSPPCPFDNREYLQGTLVSKLVAGKTYCVRFWVNLAEASGYAHNNIGAYIDNGSINTAVDSAGKAILSVVPQLYASAVLMDTCAWMKIEGTFIAKGDEEYITIGNFFDNASTTTIITNYWSSVPQYAYYLIDDVSIVESDLPADAGKDNWVAVGKTVQIGRVGDTTAEAIDCKWYHKGSLIDSGAIITVQANAVAGTIDTYVVVQTVCGLVKRDTALIKTVGLGMQETDFENAFTVYPNPAKGFVHINSATEINGTVAATIYDLSGRVLFSRQIAFDNKQASLNPNLPGGTYFLAIKYEAGRVERARIVMLE